MSSVRRENSLIKLPGIVLMAVCLPLWFIASAAAEEQSAPNAKAAPCKDLKPFNNIDELLYQFWINLDSNCLFEMPVTEMEQIWDTKILSREYAKAGGLYELRMTSDFENKPYSSEKESFFIEVAKGRKNNNNVFYLEITREYYEAHATLFPNGNFPKLLPKPLEIRSTKIPSPTFGQDAPFIPKNKGRYMMAEFDYYWLNSDKTSIIYLTGLYGVTGITVMNYVPPVYINEK